MTSTDEAADTLRIAPEPERFRRFLQRACLMTVGVCMVLAMLFALGTKNDPLTIMLVLGPSLAFTVAAAVGLAAWFFFQTHRRSAFVADPAGVQVTTDDFDDHIAWAQITDVCVRGNHVHLNTTVRIGSFELHFIDPALADQLYRRHHAARSAATSR